MRFGLPKFRRTPAAAKAPVAESAPAAEAAAPARSGRSLTVLAALVVLTVLLGIFAGAHLALSSRTGEPAKAAKPEAPQALLPVPAEVPLVTSAAPAGPTGAPPADDARALAVSRLSEEAPEAIPTLLAVAPPVPVPAAVAAAPKDMPTLLPARRPANWQRHAAKVSVAPGQPMIAIVIDDLGLRRANTERAIALPAPLTLSFLTYARGLPRLAAAARRNGHELLLHVPMEPKDQRYDPGPRVLKVGHSSAELDRRLSWALARFEGFVGINNHMGSRFTATPGAMAHVMAELRRRDLLFLDSLTSPRSVAWQAALGARVPYARRDVFLDHGSRDPAAIRGRLEALERIARQRGYAVGIGHPHSATLRVVAEWLPEARRRGFALVPISAIVSRQIEIAQNENGSAG